MIFSPHTVPVESNFQRSRRQQFEILNTLSNRPKIVFWGDSIFNHIEVTEWLQCQKIEVVNRGIGWDQTINLMESLHTVPRNIKINFILIGINDIITKNSLINSEDSVKNIKNIIEILRSKSEGEVFLITILPSDNKNHNEKIKELNHYLKRNQKSGKYELIDIFDSFIDENGLMRFDYSYDGIHLRPQGILHLIKLLKPYYKNC